MDVMATIDFGWSDDESGPVAKFTVGNKVVVSDVENSYYGNIGTITKVVVCADGSVSYRVEIQSAAGRKMVLIVEAGDIRQR